jgi:hypothetical protein
MYYFNVKYSLERDCQFYQPSPEELLVGGRARRISEHQRVSRRISTVTANRTRRFIARQTEHGMSAKARGAEKIEIIH